MGKRVTAMVVMAAAILGMATALFAADGAREKVINAAIDEAQKNGVVLADVNIIYDEGNKMWESWGAVVEKKPADPNHGVLPHGVLMNKKYQVVFFDFREGDPAKDVWAFVNPETGEIVAFYRAK